MQRNHIIATVAAGLFLFGLGLSGIQAQADGPAEWLEDYMEAMSAPERR